MRLSPIGKKLILIAALALLPSYSTFAASGSSRVPGNTAQEATVVRDEDKPVHCNGLKGDSSNCIAQEESFKRSAQAYSYLAFYMQNYSAFGAALNDKNNPDAMKENQEAVLDCLAGQNCTNSKRDKMMAALIQYNLGKGVKSMILQNNTNKENMKSVAGVKLLAGKGQAGPRTGVTYEDSFKITAADMNARGSFSPRDPKSFQDMDKMGHEFKQQYEDFIDTYTSSSGKEKWNYAHAKGSAADSHHTWQIDPATKAPVLVRDRQFYDETTQNSDVVKKKVAAFKASLYDPTFVEVKSEEEKKAEEAKKQAKAGSPNLNSMAHSRRPKHKQEDPTQPKQLGVANVDDALKFSKLKLGVAEAAVLPDGKIVTEERKVAEYIAGEINSKIDGQTKLKREVAAREGRSTSSVDVQIDVNTFDKYLEQIWPQTGIKNKIPSQN